MRGLYEQGHWVLNHLKKQDSERAAFTCFRKLPTELREMIWKEACFQQRHIDIWISPLSRKKFGRLLTKREVNTRSMFEVQSHHRVPLVLHTCAEARKVGLRYYSLEFDTSYSIKRRHRKTFQIGTPAQIYVNWECDIICPLFSKNWSWSNEADWDNQWERFNSKIKKIALDVKQAPVIEYFLNEARNITDIVLYATIQDEVLSNNPVRGKFDTQAPFNMTFEGIKCLGEHYSQSYATFNNHYVAIPDQVLLKNRLRNVEAFYFDMEREESRTKVHKGIKGRKAQVSQGQRPNVEVRAMQTADYCICRRVGKADEVICTTCTNREAHKMRAERRSRKERKYGKITSRT